MRRNKGIRVIAAAALLGLLLGGCGRARPAEETLTVTLLSVGKADAIVLQCGGETMLIDAGEPDDARKILRFLNERGIGRVDVLLITHYDRDHVGGASALAEELPPDRVLLPDYDSELKEAERFLRTLDRKGIEAERVAEPLRFALGGAEILVEPPPVFLEEVGDNDRSLMITVVHGRERLLFAGDSEKTRLRQWLAEAGREPVDFLKMPHHGVYDKALPELLQVLRPRYAAICDSDRNPADKKTLELLAASGVTVYRTAEGTIRLTSDGRSLRFEQEN